MKKFIYLLLSIANTLAASVIPTYQIASIDQNIVTLTNSAVVEILGLDFLLLKNWQAGDQIQLVFVNNPKMFYFPYQVDDGQFNNAPAFLLMNEARNNQTVAGSLLEAPEVEGDGPSPLSIYAINYLNRTITLSDMSEWIYSAAVDKIVAVWDAGNIVLIGKNSYFTSHTFDAVFINLSQQQTIITTLEQ